MKCLGCKKEISYGEYCRECCCSTCVNEWKVLAREDREAALAAVGREEPRNSDYFTQHNANIRNATQFKEDVEFIHVCHIEGAIEVACREVFTRRERAAFEAGRAAQSPVAPAPTEEQ